MSKRTLFLHVWQPSTFLDGHLRLLQGRPARERHLVLVQVPRGSNIQLPNPLGVEVRGMRALSQLLGLATHATAARRIFLHGLFTPAPLAALLLMPWTWRKLFWVVWGGDLYAGRRRRMERRLVIAHLLRRFLVKQIMHLVTYIPGDVAYARRNHAPGARMHSCLMYTSNTPPPMEAVCNAGPRRGMPHVLMGNSADPANNHAHMLRLIERRQDAVGMVTIPLSYGPAEHAHAVSALARRMLGGRCRVLDVFMTLDRYLELLDTIDIAIFNHREQQAMGNTIHLLSRGKQVYLRRNTSQWCLFRSLGLNIGASDEFDPRTCIDTSRNPGIVSRLFSQEQLHAQWDELFDVGRDVAVA